MCEWKLGNSKYKMSIDDVDDCFTWLVKRVLNELCELRLFCDSTNVEQVSNEEPSVESGSILDQNGHHQLL